MKKSLRFLEWGLGYNPQRFGIRLFFVIFCAFDILFYAGHIRAQRLQLNEQHYLEMPGLNVMLFHDFYPEGHQSGVTIIQNGVRVAANGDLRLEPTPGQWQPVPKAGERIVDSVNHQISVPCTFPNPDRDRKGFNPINYPDLKMDYRISVRAESASFRISVDLNEPLPAEWVGKVGFILELFPGKLFGKSYLMDDKAGLFPRQLSGPMKKDAAGEFQVEPLAEGKTLVIVPESDAQRMTITAQKGILQLLDGRAQHNNGWFNVRTPVPAGATQSAIEWRVQPNVLPNWQYTPVIHISQVGYHPNQKKIAFIECDEQHKSDDVTVLSRILPSGKLESVLSTKPEPWGKFTRYQYLLFDFSKEKQAGLYVISYGNSKTSAFQIGNDVFERHVWQPTLEYFLPVQMCHVRVNDRYRVWHDLCHADDALMAPLDTLHFDGYRQGSATLCAYKPGEHVPGLNVGGWHDAGDYDLRVESQAGTVRMLSLIYELFRIDYDETTVDQAQRVVELHRPDGKPDVLQQIEHGVLAILGGYKALGRFYRGIICSDLRQYVLLGDGAAMTDNRIYNSSLAEDQTTATESGVFDDRWVFTEENPRRELGVAADLAMASRALKNYNPKMAEECIQVAEALWETNKSVEGQTSAKISVLSELMITTSRPVYKKELFALQPEIAKSFRRCGESLARVKPFIDDKYFNQTLTDAVKAYAEGLSNILKENPFGVPFRPHIWGAGWNIQRFGVQQYFLHRAWPEIISRDDVFNALNYILGCHPGENTASFASGVGAKSVTVAYGTNRADWSYIPGGVVSGTAYIRPDLPELKEWPFFWQQTEYVMGGGATNFMFLVLAANQLLAE